MPYNNINSNWNGTYDSSAVQNRYSSMNQPAVNYQQPQQTQPIRPAMQNLLHYVPSEQAILTQDIPMDGNVAFFVKSDLSEIYAKTWAVDGIHGNTYVLKQAPAQNGNADPFAPIMERLDRIEKSLAQRPKNNRPKPRPKAQEGATK